MVSVCLPCDALLQHLPSYLGFSYLAAVAKWLQSCPTLCDSIEGSPPGSPVPGILQARTLKWFAIPFSSGPHSVRSNPTSKEWWLCGHRRA